MWVADKKKKRTRDEFESNKQGKHGNSGDESNQYHCDQSLEQVVVKKRSWFQSQRDEIPLMQEKIAKIKQQIQTLGTHRVYIKKRLQLKKSINELEHQIKKIESGDDEKKYDQYVEKYLQAYRWNVIQERESVKKRRVTVDSHAADNGGFNSIQKNKSNPIYSFIKGKSVTESNDTNTTTTDVSIKTEPGEPCKTPSSARINFKTQNQLILREYFTEFEGQPPPVHIVHQDICESCNQPLLLSVNNSLLTCPQCQTGYSYMDATTASMSYGEEVEFSSFTYKKVHHFEDWLKKFQGKGSKKVEKCILRKVMSWLCQHGYTQSNMIKKEHVRLALKENNQKKYYDHDMQIYCRITNKPPPSMTPEQEDVCRLMFMAIQAPFIKCRDAIDPSRTNFLSYSYCLYKFCQILGWNEFLQYFTLLKGKEKLKKQDDIWQGICEAMEWKYIPSI